MCSTHCSLPVNDSDVVTKEDQIDKNWNLI